MIFSVANHIEQIKAGTKTQTRRDSDRYQIGKFYAIQPGRTKPGIKEGKILITAKIIESRPPLQSPVMWMILPNDAKAEGGYDPVEYEELYEKLHPGWIKRCAYLFRYYSIRAIKMMERGEFPCFMLNFRKTKELKEK